MFRLFDLMVVFLERVFGLLWGEWNADDWPGTERIAGGRSTRCAH